MTISGPSADALRIAGFTVEHHATLPSTQDHARELARLGRLDHVVVADAQSAGKGRLGRPWLSPAGNLYASTIVADALPGDKRPWLSLVAALALAEAVDETSGGKAATSLKWPNDVLVGEAKLAGVLLDVEHRDGIAAVIIGTGVNVTTAPDPELAGRSTTSLAEQRERTVAPVDVLAAFLRRLRRHISTLAGNRFAEVRGAWMARAAFLQEEVIVRRGNDTVRGRFTGIDENGALQLLTDTEGTVSVFAGEVHRVIRPVAS